MNFTITPEVISSLITPLLGKAFATVVLAILSFIARKILNMYKKCIVFARSDNSITFVWTECLQFLLDIAYMFVPLLGMLYVVFLAYFFVGDTAIKLVILLPVLLILIFCLLCLKPKRDIGHTKLFILLFLLGLFVFAFVYTYNPSRIVITVGISILTGCVIFIYEYFIYHVSCKYMPSQLRSPFIFIRISKCIRLIAAVVFVVVITFFTANEYSDTILLWYTRIWYLLCLFTFIIKLIIDDTYLLDIDIYCSPESGASNGCIEQSDNVLKTKKRIQQYKNGKVEIALNNGRKRFMDADKISYIEYCEKAPKIHLLPRKAGFYILDGKEPVSFDNCKRASRSWVHFYKIENGVQTVTILKNENLTIEYEVQWGKRKGNA